ncbi:Ankyrin-1 [Dactylella cylindrospora]|nr:Ankyrin-1 [Dactylella cylindrospora]
MPPAAQQFSQADWEAHREEIEELYINQRKTNTEIQQYLAERNFGVTKKQLEYRMRDVWRFKKNLKQADYQYIHKQLQKRKVQTPGKKTNILLQGVKQSEKKLKKNLWFFDTEAYRESISQENAIAIRCPSPERPRLRTPPPDIIEIFANLKLDDLPSVRIFHRLPEVLMRLSEVYPSKDIQHLVAEDVWVEKYMHERSGVKDLWSEFLQRSAPFTHGGTVDLTDLTIKPATIGSGTVIQITGTQSLDETLGMWSKVTSEPSIESLLPRFLRRTVYLISNNLYAEEIPYIFDFIRRNELHCLLPYLLNIPLDSASSFGALLLSQAVRSVDVKFARYLLDWGAIPAKEALHEVVKQGSLDLLQLFIDRMDVDSIIKRSGATILWIPIINNDLPMFKYLVDAGADIHHISAGMNSLSEACILGRIEFVEYILQKGVHPDEAPALCEAVSFESVQLLNMLLDAGADVNIVDMIDKTPLELAVGWSNTEIAKILISRGASRNIDKALRKAIKRGNACLVEMLLEKGVRYGNAACAVELALRNKHPGLLRIILSGYMATFDEIIEADGVVESVMECGDASFLRELISYNASFLSGVVARYQGIHKVAAHGGNLEVLEMVLTAQAITSPRGQNGHHRRIIESALSALQFKHFELRDKDYLRIDLVLKMIYGGVGVNLLISQQTAQELLEESVSELLCSMRIHLRVLEDVLQCTAPHDIAMRIRFNRVIERAVELLKESGPSRRKIKAQANLNTTLVFDKAREDLLGYDDEGKLVKFFLECGVDLDKVDDRGKTALHNASERGDTEAMNMLLDAGCGIHHLDEFGRTALIYAIRSSKTEPVKLLLDRGSNWTTPTTNALVEAAKEGHMAAFLHLLERGADILTTGSVAIFRGKGMEMLELTSLEAAAAYGRTDIVRLLLDADATGRARAAELAWECGSIAISQLISADLVAQ